MHPAVWKILSGALLVCVLVQQFGLPDRALRIDSLLRHDDERPSLPSTKINTSVASDWQYEWERDGNNHGLNILQCNLAFPELYSEIDRSVKYWKLHGVREENIHLFGGNQGGVRVLIHNQQLRIIETRGLYRDDFRHRIHAVLHQIVRSVTAAEWAHEPFTNMEFTIVVDDIAVLAPPQTPSALWAFTRSGKRVTQDGLFLIPDFHFYAAPPEAEGFQMMQAKARNHDSPIEEKIPSVVWRGVEWTNTEVRRPLLDVTKGQPWADVVAMDWSDTSTVIPMDEFCRYRFGVNTEGRAWSARMTHLLNCDNVLMIHEVEWIAHYYPLLNTDVDAAQGANCVQVERNFSDLEQKVLYYNNHTNEAQEIASRARETFRERYTSPAATACYWRHLMRAWRTVSFEPRILEKMENGKEKVRGISFEGFTLHINNVDYPYEKGKR